MKTKFIYRLPDPNWSRPPEWWGSFMEYCQITAFINNWLWITVANYELRQFGGRLIMPKANPYYLRFNDESGFTAFLLRWA